MGPNGALDEAGWAARLSPVALLLAGGALALALGLAVPGSAKFAGFGLAGLALVLACFLRPTFALFVFVFLLYSRASEVLNRAMGLPASIPGMAVIFATLMVTVLVTRYGITVLRLPRLEDWYPFALYGLVQLASVLVAADPSAALTTTLTYAKDMALIAIVVMAVRRFADLWALQWALIVSMGVPALITIYQVVSGSTSEFFGFAQHYQALIATGESTLVTRPSGPLADPNFYAMALVAIIPLALHQSRYARTAALRALAGLLACAIGVAAVLTYSRGGFLALAVVIFASMLTGLLRARYVLIGAAIVLMALPFLPGSYVGRFASATTEVPASLQGDAAPATEVDTSVTGRLAVAKAGLLMFAHHPIVGVGIDNFKTRFQDYGRPLGLATRAQRSPHNLYIQVAAETGIIGLVAFAALIGSAFAHLRSGWRRWSGVPARSDMYRAFAVALIGYLTASIFLHAAYPRFLWLLLASVLAARAVQQEEPLARPARRVRSPQAVAALEMPRLALGGAGLLALSGACLVGLAALFSSGLLRERNTVVMGGSASGIGVNAAPTAVAMPSAASAPTAVAGGAATPNASATARPFQLAPVFQAFWNANGKRAILGRPTSLPIVDPDSGATVQYFEFARLEYHPEFRGTEYAIMLGRMGATEAQERGLLGTAPFQPQAAGQPGSQQCAYFPETGMSLCGAFRDFWMTHGLVLGDRAISFRESLALFGYPISREFTDPDTGLTVQYFERARLEYHPDKAGTAQAVTIGPLRERGDPSP